MNQNSTHTILTSNSNTASENNIIWLNLLLEIRYPLIRYSQLILAAYGLFETIFYLYLYYDVSFWIEWIEKAVFFF
jgi:hypothetical protein